MEHPTRVDFLSGMNPEQQNAVAHVDGPLLILAGAGSGKTRVITHRICHLITAHQVPGPAVLAVTFTNKAAGEMRERVQKLLGGFESYHHAPVLATFHSFCVRLLRRDGDRLAPLRPNFTRNFTIYDADDQLGIVKQAFRHLNLDEKFMQYRAVLSKISHAKNNGESPTDWLKTADPKAKTLAAIYERYERSLIESNAADFDDLLLLAVRLLAHDDQTRERYNRQFQYLMIDEYQDTNRTQYDLIRLLTRTHSNLAVVGDEDQSIYGWRGADIRNILDFEKDYPRARVIRLEQNYRSTRNILAAASAVVAKNLQRKGKTLWTSAAEGAKISLFEAATGEQEAMYIAQSIEREFDRDSKAKIAVLYRTNSQSRQVEEALRRYGRKYKVVGGTSFYQRAEIKDALCYLKLITSPDDSMALLRIINQPARGIGKTTLEQVEAVALEQGVSLWTALEQMCAERKFGARADAAVGAFLSLINEMRAQTELPLDGMLQNILERTGYYRMLKESNSPDSEGRLANLEELVNAAADAVERGENITEFLDHAALVAQTDELDSASAITLMTMHNAKGLEFPVVYVAGMEEGLFPHSRSRESEENLEEERRLCYVAMTRAEQRLHLSYARFRRRFGGGAPEMTIPSRFLTEVPAELLERARPGTFLDTPVSQVNLDAEQVLVRESVKKTTYTGKTYNSVENISQYFAERGMPVKPAAPSVQPASRPSPPSGPVPIRAAPVAPPPPVAPPLPGQARLGFPATPPVARPVAARAPVKKGFRNGGKVVHPKYGRGTIMRVEGDGEDAKLTISFATAGLKKLVAKYAGIESD
ncbi:MAG: UvrD-helicase domain-containing protein [Bryobacteraceae bacterium]|nr:UvrD-helicase domain-containing protein [Bryobacteraceae bacterium]